MRGSGVSEGVRRVRSALGPTFTDSPDRKGGLILFPHRTFKTHAMPMKSSALIVSAEILDKV